MPSSNPTNDCTHVQVCGSSGTAVILVANISAGVAPEMNLRNKLHVHNEAREQWAHPGFETRGGRHQKSKIMASVAYPEGISE